MYLGTDNKIAQYFLLGYCQFKDYKGLIDIVEKRTYLIHIKYYDLLPIEICLMNNFLEGVIYLMKKGANIEEIDYHKVYHGLLNNNKITDEDKKEVLFFLLEHGFKLDENNLFDLIVLKKLNTDFIEQIIKKVDNQVLPKLIKLFDKEDIDKDIRLYYNQQVHRYLHGKPFQGSYIEFKEVFIK